MSARRYRLVQVDVFTDRVFGGNPPPTPTPPGGRVSDIWVGGGVVPVLEGTLTLPAVSAR